jgi:monoterpene epsilon-lactone hydrolase
MSWQLPPERQAGQPAPESLTARRAGAAAAMAEQPAAPGVTVSDQVVGGVAAVECRPSSATSTVLYLHGGGYRLGTPRSWIAFASGLAAATASRVLIADYRLAPEDPFPAALHDAVAIYEALRHQEGPLVVAGDSAGGGLAVALVAASLLAGHAVPDGLVVMSPWVDLTLTSPTFETRATTDQLFPRSSAVEAAQAYLQGVDAGDPLASPLFADLGGFPPTLVFAGGAETLLGDGLSLATRLAEAGVSVEAHFPAGMQHVWPTLFPDLPESKAALAAIVRFVAAAVDAHSDTMANR